MQIIKCPNCGEDFELSGSGFADILKQIRDQQFAEEVSVKVNDAVKLAVEQTRNSLNQEVTKIKESLHDTQAAKVAIEAEKEKALIELKAAKDAEIANLQAKIDKAEVEKQLSVTEAVSSVVKQCDELKIELVNKEKQEQFTRETYEKRLQDQEAIIERIKDFRHRMSTKMIGESLEQYCQNEFNKIRATAFPNSHFEKDNDSKGGTKGDFIFRDPASGVESLSIMFEMKNESEETVQKQKNESFFAKLDRDRNEKKCEYAVLVSTLEEESDLYNQGIVDVSHLYPKMFVIRPQFFIPLISLLKNAAEKSLALKNELALIKGQNIDITTFEDDISNWKDSFFTSIRKAAKQHENAIAQIDKAIDNLKRVREALSTSDNHLSNAENKMADLTIKRLTRKNPTMQAKFAELEEAKISNTKKLD